MVLNGSGERDSVIARWHADDGVNVVERIRRLVQLPLSGARLSSRLHMVAPEIDDLAVLTRELRRLLSRTEGLKDEAASQAASDLDTLHFRGAAAKGQTAGDRGRI